MNYSMNENGFTGHLPFGDIQISGDEEYGFRPYQLLISSLAVCSGGVMRKVLDKMRMPAKDIQIEVTEVVRNDEEAGRVEKVHLHFTITGDIDEKKMARVMELTRKNCSMVQSVKDSIEIIESFEVRQT
ncbi:MULTISPECIES: OsmC family protein [Planococcus]|uniref:Osmotically inducible protein C n=1 Tax=Planococcus faecalis TaxID=1598147 RepID=A0ABM6IQT4_9BACL|nr:MULTISPECIES: OsmC family protein [Planococcus]AQU78666.1 osmotically inducible protein C [Planococcus faecalis]MDJ0332141.1 OsmC family protein [Planococcus sp. S3-L1]OHX54489.1 osmotically inducible protein C [Planococcus faecalis]